MPPPGRSARSRTSSDASRRGRGSCSNRCRNTAVATAYGRLAATTNRSPGGITSAVTLQHGLGAGEAEVVGPVLPGVSHWHAIGRRGPLEYLVVPGNVGDDDLLLGLVERLLRG